MSKINNSQSLWRKHLSDFDKNNLSAAEYCREHNLVYSQFLYWRSKFAKNVVITANPKPTSDFVPVKLPALDNDTMTRAGDKKYTVLCSIEFVQGHRLMIHSNECLKLLPKILGKLCLLQATTGN